MKDLSVPFLIFLVFCLTSLSVGSVPAVAPSCHIAENDVGSIDVQIEYVLGVSSPHGILAPLAGNHYFAEGQHVICTAASPVTEYGTIWTCTGWTGTGSVPSVGNRTSLSFIISENSSIVWNWSPADNPPIAEFSFGGPITSFTPNIVYPQSPARFNASLSHDLDGTISSYSWDFGDGLNGSGSVVDHCFGSSGFYTVTLTLTDNGGATNSTSKNVYVDPLKWEIYVEIDYMIGHNPSNIVLQRVQQYYRDNGINLQFLVDDQIPAAPDVTFDEFWEYQKQYNDVWRYDDHANDTPVSSYAKTRLKEKWIFYATVDDPDDAFGYIWANSTDAGNWVFMADGTIDQWADLNSLISRFDAEEVVLMHELGHSIGILVKNIDGTEKYDDDFYSVMSYVTVENCAIYPKRYSSDYWAEKNLEYYAISDSRLELTTNSSVNILLTDQLGRRIGFDSSGGESVNEIPGATYSGSGVWPQTICVLEPLEGNYFVKASGTETGPYTITVKTIINGSTSDRYNWQSTISEGEQVETFMRLDPDGTIILPHDIELNVTPFRTTLFKNCSVSVATAALNISVENHGDDTETFAVYVFMNGTITEVFDNVVLFPKTSTEFQYIVDSGSFVMGDFNLTVYATSVQGEFDVSNNGRMFEISVTILGDTNADRIVNVLDLILIAGHLRHTGGDDHAPYSAELYQCMNTDINGDGQHNVLDLIIVANHLGQHG